MEYGFPSFCMLYLKHACTKCEDTETLDCAIFPQGFTWGFCFCFCFSFSKPSSWLNLNYTLCLFRSNLKAHSVLLSSPRLTADFLGHRWFKHLPTMQVAFMGQDSGLCLPGSPLSETLSYFLVSVSAWTLDTDLSGQKVPHYIVSCPICRPLRPFILWI